VRRVPSCYFETLPLIVSCEELHQLKTYQKPEQTHHRVMFFVCFIFARKKKEREEEGRSLLDAQYSTGCNYIQILHYELHFLFVQLNKYI